MAETHSAQATNSRFFFLGWALGVCPLLGWLIGFVWVGATDPPIIGISLFFGVPALLAAFVGAVVRRSAVEVVVAAIGASALTGLSWVVSILWMASRGAFQ